MRLNYVVQALPMKLAIAVLVVNVYRNLAAMKTCMPSSLSSYLKIERYDPVLYSSLLK